LGFIGLTQLKSMAQPIHSRLKGDVCRTYANESVGQPQSAYFVGRIYSRKNYKIVKKILMYAAFCLERFAQKVLP